MADYDNAEVTERERLAAQRQNELAKYNAASVSNQLSRQLQNYDTANSQNKRLADVQLKQNSRKSEADRFEANRNLQNSALGLLGSMGNAAINSSSLLNLSRMLENRNDADNQTYWGQLQDNQNAVRNALDESLNQNTVAKLDATANAEKALRDIQADTAANIANINPSLYVEPGTGDTDLGAGSIYDANKVEQNNAVLSGYLMPENSVQTARQQSPRNRVVGTDYFSRLMNYINRR